jgi:hypothetical protein
MIRVHRASDIIACLHGYELAAAMAAYKSCC